MTEPKCRAFKARKNCAANAIQRRWKFLAWAGQTMKHSSHTHTQSHTRTDSSCHAPWCSPTQEEGNNKDAQLCWFLILNIKIYTINLWATKHGARLWVWVGGAGFRSKGLDTARDNALLWRTLTMASTVHTTKREKKVYRISHLYIWHSIFCIDKSDTWQTAAANKMKVTFWATLIHHCERVCVREYV